MPNCTVIKTGATISGNGSGRASELKRLIDDIYLPYSAQKAGDAVFYDSVNKKIVIGDKDADFATEFPAEQFTPIGVVAIPGDHLTAKSGKRGVVSLKYMNCSTPDEGSTSSSNICWGQYNVDTELPNLDVVVGAGTRTSPTAEASGTTGSNYLPSDNFSAVVCPTDPEAYYYNTSTSSNSAAPSPYLEDGSRNPVYYQTTSPSSEANCLSDFDGKGNTEVLCNLATAQGDWKTASTITNSYNGAWSPAACCCWRYHTDGTEQGDWYLPAMGELGYVMVRLKTINATIAKLVEVYGDTIGSQIGTSAYLWSSSEYSASNARYVYASNGTVGNNGRNNSYGSIYVRAFLRV